MENRLVEYPVPYIIRTPRLVLRCLRLHDLPKMDEAIGKNIEHLRPTMPWAAKEPLADAERAAVIEKARERYVGGIDFMMGIFDPGEERMIGGTGLHPRGRKDFLEIGYWIREEECRKGYAKEVATALTVVALGMIKVPRLEIRCDVRNIGSSRVPMGLGFTLEGTLRQNVRNPLGEMCDVEVWALLEREFEGWAYKDFLIVCEH